MGFKLVEHLTGLVAASAVAFFLFGQDIESTFFPPTTFEGVTAVHQLDDGYVVRFSAYRNRECAYIDSRWYVDTDIGLEHVPTAGPLAHLPKNRPAGDNVSPPNFLPYPGTFYLRITYDCGFPWQSTVLLGPMKVP